jgi:hypothetical protein
MALGYQHYALAALYPQKDILVLISVRGQVNHRAVVWLEGLGKVKKLVTSFGVILL